MRILFFSILLLGAATVRGDIPAAARQTVSETLQELAGAVSECRLQLAADPVAVRGLVDHRLRPKADVLHAGQLILGRHWSDADPAQRRRFAEALYSSLVNRYASGLLLLTPNNVSVAPASAAQDEAQAEVELRVHAGLATPVPVFLQLRSGNGRWRIYDARWEGQSYVFSLRNAFAQQIRRDGLETVIGRLEASAGTPAGPPEERETAAGRCLRARMN